MKKHFRAIGDFWRVEYGRYVGMTAIAFLVLVVLAYIAGRLFPDIPVTVIGAFNGRCRFRHRAGGRQL